MTISDEDIAARLDRVERIQILRTNDRPDKPAELVALEEALAADLDNRMDADGHSPKMLRDWATMQQAQIDSGEAKDVAEADSQLDAYFTDIKEGRRDADGNLVK